MVSTRNACENTRQRLNVELWLLSGSTPRMVGIPGARQVAGREGEHQETASCLAPYQIYVHLGVAQGTTSSIAGYDSMVHLIHGLLSYQINGKALIHLE